MGHGAMRSSDSKVANNAATATRRELPISLCARCRSNFTPLAELASADCERPANLRRASSSTACTFAAWTELRRQRGPVLLDRVGHGEVFRLPILFRLLECRPAIVDGLLNGRRIGGIAGVRLQLGEERR